MNDDLVRRDRRILLQGAAGMAAAALAPAGASLAARPKRVVHAPVGFQAETMARWAQQWTEFCLVQGYARRPSVVRGEAVELCVSSRAARYGVRVTRVGADREVAWTRTGLTGREHPVPSDAAQWGCRWPITLEVPTGDLRPGYYEVALIAEGVSGPRALGHAFFVVRPRSGEEQRLLVALATNTDAAYNTWGGPSLYDGATQVSFERPLDRGMIWRKDEAIEDRAMLPYSARVSADPGLMRVVERYTARTMNFRAAFAGWFNWEMPFVRWAERCGYGVDLCTNLDVADAAVLDRHRVLVSVGHDEYWTMAMREGVEGWVRDGGRLAVLSGNTCSWQVRVSGSVMIGFKERADTDDPVVGTADQRLMTGPFIHPFVARPENALFGVGTNGGLYSRSGGLASRGAGGLTVWREDHWALEGTGLGYGDCFGIEAGITGYEAMGCRLQFGPDGLPVALRDAGTPEAFIVLASAPAVYGTAGAAGRGDATLERATATMLYGRTDAVLEQRIRHGHVVVGTMPLGRGEVFSGSTTNWIYGVQSDPAIERMTRNVLDRFLANTAR